MWKVYMWKLQAQSNASNMKRFTESQVGWISLSLPINSEEQTNAWNTDLLFGNGEECLAGLHFALGLAAQAAFWRPPPPHTHTHERALTAVRLAEHLYAQRQQAKESQTAGSIFKHTLIVWMKSKPTQLKHRHLADPLLSRSGSLLPFPCSHCIIQLIG